MRLMPRSSVRAVSLAGWTGLQFFLRKASRLTTSALPAGVSPLVGLRGQFLRRRLRLPRRPSVRPATASPLRVRVSRLQLDRLGCDRRAWPDAASSKLDSRLRPSWLSNFRPNCTDGSKKAGEGVEGDQQPLRDAREGQPDLEGVLGDAEIPELMLEDDGHLLRVLFAQAVRQANAGKIRPERDVEMVFARKPVLAGIDQHLAHDTLQGVLHQEIVADQVFPGHERALAETKVEASVARCLRTPPNGATR